jgi:hypothetical protein
VRPAGRFYEDIGEYSVTAEKREEIVVSGLNKEVNESAAGAYRFH